MLILEYFELIIRHVGRFGLFFARRAYCVGEALENHVCPCVRCPLSGVRVRTIFDPVSELENEDTSAISEKKSSEKGPKCDIWFQVRDGSRPKNNSNLVTFRTSQDSDEATYHFGETSLRATLLRRSVLVYYNMSILELDKLFLGTLC